MQCSFCNSRRPDQSNCINKSIIRTITPPALAFALVLPMALRANEQRSASLSPERLRANEQSHSQRQTLCEQTSKVPACRLTFARNRCEQSACKASKAVSAAKPLRAKSLARPLLVCSQLDGG